MNKMNTNNNGFTLVELIVVIVIISILSTLAIPSVLAYIDEAKTQQDIINAKELMLAGQKLMDEIYDNPDDFLYLTHNFNPQNNSLPTLTKESDCYRINWYSVYSDRFKDIAGLYKGNTSTTFEFSENAPFLIGLCVGNYYTFGNSADPRIKRKAYTVYGIIYQRTPDSNAIYYDGNQWNTDLKGTFPFDIGNDSNTLMIDGKKMKMTIYYINKFVHPSDLKVGEKIKQYGRTTF